MVIDKNFNGLKDGGWRYEYDGNIDTDEHLEIILDKGLYVSGYIKTGWYIEAGGYIEAGCYIEAGWYIKTGGYIKAGQFIEAGRYIEAGGFIEAGDEYGISAGLNITCKGELLFGLKCFAGICAWREIDDEEKTVTCGRFEGGTLEYGILNEVGMPEEKEEPSDVDVEEVTINGKRYRRIE